MLFEVAFERIETYVERIPLEADSAEEAAQKAEEMIESGEVSFDGEVVAGNESVLEIIEWVDQP